jgi:hypothetical protein
VASGAIAPGPALEGVLRFRPKLVHKQEKILWIMKKLFVRQVASLSTLEIINVCGSIPVEIAIM